MGKDAFYKRKELIRGKLNKNNYLHVELVYYNNASKVFYNNASKVRVLES